MIDTSNFEDGDAVYRHGGTIYINGELVSMEDIPDMSEDELNEFHDSLMETISSGKRTQYLYDFLTFVNGEFARRD